MNSDAEPAAGRQGSAVLKERLDRATRPLLYNVCLADVGSASTAKIKSPVDADLAPLDYDGVPALVAGYDPKWRHVPTTRALIPPSPETGPAPKWGRPSLILTGKRYETGEMVDGTGRSIVVKIVGYALARGRWECVVVSSGKRSKRQAGDHVFRLAKDLKRKGTP